MPYIPMPWNIMKTMKLRAQHPELKRHPAVEMLRRLPGKKDIG